MRQVIQNPEQLGAVLRGRRKARRIPQRELAVALGITQPMLSVQESTPATLPLARLLLLAKLLDLEIVVQDRPEPAARRAPVGTKLEW